MADLDPALIEKMRDVLQQHLPSVVLLARHVEAALLSLGIPAAALNAIARGEAVVTPVAVPWWTDKTTWDMHLAASPYRSEP